MEYMNKEYKQQLPAGSDRKGSLQSNRQVTNKGVAATATFFHMSHTTFALFP